jgi:hypothetical protein
MVLSPPWNTRKYVYSQIDTQKVDSDRNDDGLSDFINPSAINSKGQLTIELHTSPTRRDTMPSKTVEMPR